MCIGFGMNAALTCIVSSWMTGQQERLTLHEGKFESRRLHTRMNSRARLAKAGVDLYNALKGKRSTEKFELFKNQ